MSDTSRSSDADAASPMRPSIRRRATTRAFSIESVETVAMTAEQYEDAVNALASLIVAWMRSRALAEPGSEAAAD
jgi:hypothetical protein